MSEEDNNKQIPEFIVQKDNQYSVECQTQMAKDCLKNGEYCDSHEEAQEWVEDECWIFSGEGWICITCNEHIMRNLAKVRRSKSDDERDDDLEVGINTVR